jgi:hypothetical protein
MANLSLGIALCTVAGCAIIVASAFLPDEYRDMAAYLFALTLVCVLTRSSWDCFDATHTENER